MTTDADVIIIGAGPTGLTLANLLGQRRVRAILLEARDELIDYPRAVGIDDEALRAMQAIGLVDEVLPHTVPDQRIRMVNADLKLIGDVNPTTREFGWPRRNGFVQPLVDRVLLDGLDRFETIDVRFGAEAVGIDQDETGVTVRVRTADGTEHELRAAYLVGAEGGASFTRKALGLSFDGETRKQRGLVIDVANDPIGTPHAVFGGDPKRGYATLQLPHGIRRWEFMLHEQETDDLVDSDEFVHGLLRAHVPDPAAVQIIRRRVYVHHARLAPTMRVGRVLLAGDAAHVMPVVAGQGWNSCIRDAINLGWKLHWVVSGAADDELLDTYDSERLSHARSIVQLSLNMANVMTSTNRLKTGARDAAASVLNRFSKAKSYIAGQGFKPLPNYEHGAVVAGTRPTSKSVYVADGFRSAVGTLFPQPRVRTATVPDLLLDDATGADWRILTWNNDPAAFLTEATRARFEALGGALVHVVPAVQVAWAEANSAQGVVVVGDPVGALKDWFHARPFGAYIVRPDNVIAAECFPQELESTLQRVFQATRLR